MDDFGDNRGGDVEDNALRDAALALTLECGEPADFVWDPDPESFSLKTLRTFHEKCQELPRHPDNGLALISSFDVVSFSKTIGYLIYIDVVNGGRDFYYRVYGSRIAQFSGFDLTGQTLAQSHPPEASRKFMLETYRAVLRRRHVLFTIHSPPKNFLIATWSRLLVPMSGDDGEVSRLLVCSVPTLTREGLMPVRSVYGDIDIQNRHR
ncbi:MAG: hypothetical protein RIM33_15175 [Alphaproteobacteria bacterium]